MLREVIDSEHQVFVFKLVVFLLATVEIGGKDNALRFLRAGGAMVLVPLIVLSLSKVSSLCLIDFSLSLLSFQT